MVSASRSLSLPKLHIPAYFGIYLRGWLKAVLVSLVVYMIYSATGSLLIRLANAVGADIDQVRLIYQFTGSRAAAAFFALFSMGVVVCKLVYYIKWIKRLKPQNV